MELLGIEGRPCPSPHVKRSVKGIETEAGGKFGALLLLGFLPLSHESHWRGNRLVP